MKAFRPILPRLLAAALLLAAMLPGVGAAQSEAPAVTGIGGTVTAGEGRISFRLRNAFPPEMVEALKTGVEITFRYDARVEVVRHGWFNTTLAEGTGSRSIRYDALARVYRLQRGGKEELLPDVRSAIEAMTRYDLSLPLDGAVAKGDRVRAWARVRLDHVGLSEPLRTILFFTRLWDVQTPWARGYLSHP